MSVVKQDLERLHGESDGVIFIGWIPKGGTRDDFRHKPFQANQLDEMIKHLDGLGEADRYISCSVFHDGSSRKVDNVSACHWLVADYDCKAKYRKTDNLPFDTVEECVEEVCKNIEKCGLRVTIIKTGGGIQTRIRVADNLAQLNAHKYRNLSEAFFQAGLPLDKKIEYHNDTKDQARIIRLPGYENTKAGVMAEVHSYSDEVYTLDELKQKLGLTDLQAVKELPKPRRSAEVQLSELPSDWLEWVQSYSLEKFKQTGTYSSSSEKEMAIQGYLYRKGMIGLDQQLEFFRSNIHKSSHFWTYNNDGTRKAYLERGLQKITASNPANQNYDWHDPNSNKVDVNKLVAWFDKNRDLFMDDFRLFDQTLRMWDGRKWVVSSDSTLEKYFFSYFQERGLALRRGHIKELCSSFNLYEFKHTRIEDFELDYTKKIAIAFSNGTLYINSENMAHHFKENEWDKLDYSLYHIEYEYDEELMTLDWRSTTVGQHLKEFYSENGIEAIQLFVASVLIPQFDLQKCLYMFGEGCNGKGMITRTFQSLFSAGSVTSLNVSRWGANHENIVLKDSVMNISNEIQNRDLSSDVFKAVVACDYITFNPKYEDPFQAKLFAKHIFTANELPNTGVDKALARRLLFVKSKKSVPMKQQSSTYEVNYRKHGKRVWLAIALQGIFELTKLGFRINSGDQECKLDWIEDNDGLYEFIQDTFVQGTPDDFIPTSDIYELYFNWKSTNNKNEAMRNMTSNKMSARLGKILSALEWQCIKDRGVVNKKQVRGWYGLKLKSKKPELELVSTNW